MRVMYDIWYFYMVICGYYDTLFEIRFSYDVFSRRFIGCIWSIYSIYNLIIIIIIIIMIVIIIYHLTRVTGVALERQEVLLILSKYM
jgi:hypothetical protein